MNVKIGDKRKKKKKKKRYKQRSYYKVKRLKKRGETGEIGKETVGKRVETTRETRGNDKGKWGNDWELSRND